MQQRYYDEESPRRVRPPIDEMEDQQTTILPKKKRKGASPDPWKPGSDQKRAVAPPIVEKPDFDSQGYIRGEVFYEQGAPSTPVIHVDEVFPQEEEDQGWRFEFFMFYARIALVVMVVLAALTMIVRQSGFIHVLFH